MINNQKINRLNFAVTGILFFLFVVFTTLLKYLDVRPVGPRGSLVGLASINKTVSELLGANMFLYNVTDWFGVVAIMVVFGFALLGLVQLIKRKSLKCVDYSIYVLGAFYFIVAVAYVFFEFFVVNYRPVLIQNVLEASYPSSTTMVILCVIPTAIMQFNRLIKEKRMRNIVNTVFIVFAVVTVVGRLLSGVHWLTDILGGILLSSTLVMLYYSVDKYIGFKQ